MLPILKNIKAESNLCKKELEMDKVCIKYVPAKRYAEELHSVMLKCFPDFWTPRFAEGNYAFPYDVKMYLLSVDGKKAGQIGYHPYSFHFCGKLRTTGGICDVGGSAGIPRERLFNNPAGVFVRKDHKKI